MSKLKLAAVVPIALVFTLLAAVEYLYFPGRSDRAHLRALDAKAVAVSELTAHAVGPGLEFDDKASVEEHLAGAARDAELEYIAVFTSKGELYAAVNEVNAALAPPAPSKTTREDLVGAHLQVVAPIPIRSGEPGMLLAGFSTENIARQSKESHQAALLIAAAIFALGLIVSVVNGVAVQRIENLLAENRTARVRAEAASKAKSEFLANMSHELRTPMNGVLGMASLLMTTEMTARQRRFADAIRRSGQNLLAIISDILDFSKIEAGKLELDSLTFDLRSLVEDVAESLSAEAQNKGLELVCRVAPTLPVAVRGDPLRLSQILLNLLGNAIKFTSRGEVTINVDLEGKDQSSHRVAFRVTDTGVGITKQKQAELFTAFMQADTSTTRVYGGTGLGLAISKRLVELMGGTITVESEPNRGSTFSFTTVLGKLGAGDVGPSIARISGKRALIVDDNATNREFLSEVLTAWGVVSEQVESGDAALDAIERSIAQGKPFDLLLLDMHMPHMDGEELAKRISSDARVTAPMVLLTSAMDHDRKALEAMGIKAWLPKPLRQSTLLETLTAVVGGDSLRSNRPGDGGAAAGVLAGQGLQVLAAEDNDANQQVLAGLAEYLGFDITVVGNGQKAVEAVDARKTPFSAILMDCQMPVLDGYRATRAIRDLEARLGRPRVPIIAVTAHALPGERERVIEAGMDDYVTKPIDTTLLLRKLEKWARPLAPAKPEYVVARPDAAPESEKPPKSVGGSRPIDQNVIAQLKQLQTAKRPRFFVDLVEKYAVGSATYLEGIASAVEKKDASLLRESAHALKGSSRSVGALRASMFCEALEGLGKSGTTDGGRELLGRLEPALVEAIRELRAIASA